MKRPAWCIESMMDALNKEFEPSRLVGVRGAAIRYMARSSKSFQNLKPLYWGQGLIQKVQGDGLHFSSSENLQHWVRVIQTVQGGLTFF